MKIGQLALDVAGIFFRTIFSLKPNGSCMPNLMCIGSKLKGQYAKAVAVRIGSSIPALIKTCFY